MTKPNTNEKTFESADNGIVCGGISNMQMHSRIVSKCDLHAWLAKVFQHSIEV